MIDLTPWSIRCMFLIGTVSCHPRERTVRLLHGTSPPSLSHTPAEVPLSWPEGIDSLPIRQHNLHLLTCVSIITNWSLTVASLCESFNVLYNCSSIPSWAPFLHHCSTWCFSCLLRVIHISLLLWFQLAQVFRTVRFHMTHSCRKSCYCRITVDTVLLICIADYWTDTG